MAHILLIEDDPVLGPRLKRNLELSGYRLTLATGGQGGLATAVNRHHDLIILDLMLPGLDGMKILHKIRGKGNDTPVIILTAKGTERDRLEGFREGCDDYLTKPFSFPELTARIKAVLRRCGYKAEQRILNSGGISIDPNTRTVMCGTDQIDLTPREFDLLYMLISHSNRAISRYALLDEIWGEDKDVTIRTIDAHVSYLRRKLMDVKGILGQIVTVYKSGYTWEVISDENLESI